MVPQLRELCKIFVFKHGIQGRELLPRGLNMELESLDTNTKLNISGNFYEDFHINSRHAMEIDINWSRGAWIIRMRKRNERREIVLTAGNFSYLDSGWGDLFLLACGGMPFPVREDILVYDFDIYPVRRSVVFSGQFLNHYSDIICQFKTEFSFSVTSHFLRVQTEMLSGQIYWPVGVRFMRQPDTPSYDFFKYTKPKYPSIRTH